jgi:hypothetical protein
LTEFQRAGEAALAELDLIDDQGSIEQVSVHLAGGQQELTTAVQRVDAVTGLVDEALEACAQAGQRGLPAALNALREDVVETRGRLEQSSNACDVERLSIEAWLQENPDDSATSGAPEAASGLSGPGGAASAVQPAAPEVSSPPASPAEPTDTFDGLLDPAGPTLLPRGAESGDGFRLRPVEDRDDLRARATDTTPEEGLTRRTRRLLAWTAAGTFIGQTTVGAWLEFGSSMGQAIGTVVFGAAAMIIEAPEIVKTLRETRRKKPTEPGLRIRAHGK